MKDQRKSDQEVKETNSDEEESTPYQPYLKILYEKNRLREAACQIRHVGHLGAHGTRLDSEHGKYFANFISGFCTPHTVSALNMDWITTLIENQNQQSLSLRRLGKIE